MVMTDVADTIGERSRMEGRAMLIAQPVSDAQLTVWDRILIAGVGPAIAAILGTGIISLLVWLIQAKRETAEKTAEGARKTAEKRRDEERQTLARDLQWKREDSEKRLQQERANSSLRYELIGAMCGTAASLYLASQAYYRASRSKDDQQRDLAPALAKFEEQYVKSRTDGEILEARLKVYFIDEVPRVQWHRITDLLTVRYMQLTGADSDIVYKINAKDYEGKEHSGLTAAELRKSETLLSAYRKGLEEALETVQYAEFRPSADAIERTSPETP